MKLIKVGTRNSPLAIKQAEYVCNYLKLKGYTTKIVYIKSYGDKNLNSPIYKMGITGVFTKELDIALINHKIDVAVHSLKDIPTTLPLGICLSGILNRDYYSDIVIYKNKINNNSKIVATGSLRRRAFWYNYYRNSDRFINIRGNINTRVNTFISNNIDILISSKAAIYRIGLQNFLLQNGLSFVEADYMLPAPCQGIIAITCREDDKDKFNLFNRDSMVYATVERDFLRSLNIGCSFPVGAIVTKLDENIYLFKAALLSLLGDKIVRLEQTFSYNDFNKKGNEFAKLILLQGGRNIINDIKKNLIEKKNTYN